MPDQPASPDPTHHSWQPPVHQQRDPAPPQHLRRAIQVGLVLVLCLPQRLVLHPQLCGWAAQAGGWWQGRAGRGRR